MGQVLAAPIGALGTCVGACSGSALAVCCGKLAGSGTLDSEKAARVMLIWLQVFTTVVALFTAATPQKWLPWTCDKLKIIDASGLGVCECRDKADEMSCWSDQLIYRTELSGFVIFAALLVMTFSGCAQGASRSQTVAKFMAVPVLGFALLFAPNGLLDDFGLLATSAAAVFLVVQALLLIDFAYTWNETWHGFAIMAQRRELNTKRKKMWLGLIVLSSAALFVTALTVSICLFAAYPGSRALIVTAPVIGLILLVVSITDWCEHGALLTSCVMLLYSVWLVYEALASQPGQQRPQLWPGLLLAAFSLGASAYRGMEVGTSGSTAGAGSAAGSGAAASLAEEGGAEPASGERPSSADKKDFAIQCAVHAAAALYITSLLAAKAGNVQHALHVVAVFAALLLYGWSLVAPKLLTNRDFR